MEDFAAANEEATCSNSSAKASKLLNVSMAADIGNWNQILLNTAHMQMCIRSTLTALAHHSRKQITATAFSTLILLGGSHVLQYQRGIAIGYAHLLKQQVIDRMTHVSYTV